VTPNRKSSFQSALAMHQEYCRAIPPDWINSGPSEIYLESIAGRSRIRRELLVMHPAGRLGESRDIGNLAVSFASNERRFATGHVFVMDGGRTKKLPHQTGSPGGHPTSVSRRNSAWCSNSAVGTSDNDSRMNQPLIQY